MTHQKTSVCYFLFINVAQSETGKTQTQSKTLFLAGMFKH